ncbi:hypothetical protein FB567DRAFT_175198 [Paraphoma chrysanthemicola]|uniref:Uncharacterized protein n=1 Tax=Paraphoma chrysanthemicola TaxID=798071 RepID=A0A8K0W3N5_9PLEO|nr:hypothetical protein FB567DRAFT_175198 [Paraphoma chrysanthemicola]
MRLLSWASNGDCARGDDVRRRAMRSEAGTAFSGRRVTTLVRTALGAPSHVISSSLIESGQPTQSASPHRLTAFGACRSLPLSPRLPRVHTRRRRIPPANNATLRRWVGGTAQCFICAPTDHAFRSIAHPSLESFPARSTTATLRALMGPMSAADIGADCQLPGPPRPSPSIPISPNLPIDARLEWCRLERSVVPWTARLGCPPITKQHCREHGL